MLLIIIIEQDGQYLRPSDPAYEQVLDSLAMVARHTPVPLLEALLRWRERYLDMHLKFLPVVALRICYIQLVSVIIELKVTQ